MDNQLWKQICESIHEREALCTHKTMDNFQQIVNIIRDYRSRNNIHPALNIELVIIETQDVEWIRIWDKINYVIKGMCKINLINLVTNMDKPLTYTYKEMIDIGTIYIIDNRFDNNSIEKTEKRITELQRLIEISENKLDKFTDKTPKAIVQQEIGKLSKYNIEIEGYRICLK